MKTITTLTTMLAGMLLTISPIRSEEPAKEMKCPACKKEEAAKKQEMEKKMLAMEARMKADAEEFDKLLGEMNASTGEKKIAAMSAIINRMAQRQKEAHAKVGGIMKKDGKSGEVDYYTCKMHPAVHSPVPGKCPVCSMELVPVMKKPADAKPGEDPKKAEDPHAGHH